MTHIELIMGEFTKNQCTLAYAAFIVLMPGYYAPCHHLMNAITPAMFN